MIRIQLDDVTRSELNALRRSDLPALARDRLEMAALSDAGWSPPRIADHLGYHPQTVRNLLRDFAARGRDALFPAKPGPPPDAERRRQVTDALRELIPQERTWTSRQLGEALRERGIAIGPRQVRRYLRLLDAGYRRTSTTLKHKQDPAKVDRAKRVLANLKKKWPRAG
jgi:putative transposase